VEYRVQNNKNSLSLLLAVVCAYISFGADTGRVWGAGGEGAVKDWELMWDYVPNQLLVKYKEEAEGGGQVSESLQRLQARYGVRKAEKVFPGYPKQRRRMAEILGTDPARMTEGEKRLWRRSQRARVGAAAPALERIYLLEMEEGQDIKAALAAYRQDPQVEYAELNYLVYEHTTPNDPYYSIQWPLRNTAQIYPESGKYNTPPGTYDADIDASGAWDIFTGDAEVIVAVIDTGVDYAHRDIDENMWVNEAELNGTAGEDDDYNGYVDDVYGYDFVNRDGDPMDDRGHGTHCAGVIGAETDNGLDIAGICWDARIMAVKFLNSGGSGTTANAVKSFYYAVANGADICSNSWGGGPYSETLEEAINYADSQGVILVASAGNDNTSNPEYPAYYEPMISVAATDSNDEKAPFSNYGDWVDLAAPGVDVLSLRSSLTPSWFGTAYDDYTFILSGTSMSCPHVAGACALLIGANPTLTRDEVYGLLMTTGDPINPGLCLADSRINVKYALREAVPARGRVQFTREAYSCADEVAVILADDDLAGAGSEPVLLETTGGDTETLTMIERAEGIGVYDGTMATSSDSVSIGNGVLELTHGETITVTYVDTDDGTGNGALSEDTATADCAGPVISNVQAAQVGAFWARISFETDEPSTGLVPYGKNCNNLNDGTGEDMVLSDSHNVYIYNLDSETTYRFEVTATDALGNETTDDNGGSCYEFTTAAEVGGLHVPIEYPTIQAAIDAAPPMGETVWVADGVWQGEGNRDLDFGGRQLIVRSEFGPEHCVIECAGSVEEPRYGFYFHNGEGADSAVNGFTITGGYAQYIEYIGGGIICDASHPTIENCIFTNNVGVYGGGLKNTNSSPTITNCRFENNAAHLFGGAMDNYNGSHPIVTDCVFLGNVTDSVYSDEYGGGAVGNDDYSHPTFVGCRFEDNFTYGLGAGMYNEGNCSPILKDCVFVNNDAAWGGGGMASDYGNCQPFVVNCRFYGNTAQQGGAVYCGYNNTLTMMNCLFSGNEAGDEGGGIWIYSSTMQVVNSTFTGNEAKGWGGGIYLESGVSGDVSNSILWQNRDYDGYSLDGQIYGWQDLGLHYNCIENWVEVGQGDKEGNVNGDPLFLDADGEDDIAGTEDDNLRPGPGSPCIDAGDNNRIPEDQADLDGDTIITEPTPWDLDECNRQVDDPNTPDTGLTGPNPSTPIVDMGAYEGPYQGFRITPWLVEVPEGATASFTVALGLDPQGPVTVTVAYLSGDSDISVQSGWELYFDSSNYDQPQTVVLAGAEDGDFINGTTWIRVSSAGIPKAKVKAVEWDNEPVPTVVYVDKAATGNETGLRWSDAFTDLQMPLEFISPLSGVMEVRVAQGTYRPAGAGGSRYASFMLISGLALRGGYAGVQGSNPDVQDPEMYPAILSGDLNGDDDVDPQNYQENSYHVVASKELSADTVLEGFIVEGGYANGRNIHANGGGVLNREESDLRILDCTFRKNRTNGSGAGIHIESSSPTLIRCRFGDNVLGGNSGGALYCKDGNPELTQCSFIANTGGVGGAVAFYGSSVPEVKHCEFRQNSASFGGAWYSRDTCNAIVEDCIFAGNYTGYTGAGIEIRDGAPTFRRCLIQDNVAGEYDWGGAGISAFGGTATFESCTITGNHSYENGGAMFVWNCIVTMRNCTISGNSADLQGGGIFLFGHLSGAATLNSCILWDNQATEVEGKTISVQYSDVKGGYGGTGNRNLDPLFVDTARGDYHLRWSSPCIDLGDPDYVPTGDDRDIDREPRVMRGDRVDMGSDEVGPKQADYTRNGKIDGYDLAIFLQSWLAAEGEPNWYVLCDLYEDQQIDLRDYGQFAADWLWQAEWYGVEK